MKASAVDEIPGVGPTKAKALIRHFGSLQRLKEASVEQIALVPGVGESTAKTIHAALHAPHGTMEA